MYKHSQSFCQRVKIAKILNGKWYDCRFLIEALCCVATLYQQPTRYIKKSNDYLSSASTDVVATKKIGWQNRSKAKQSVKQNKTISLVFVSYTLRFSKRMVIWIRLLKVPFRHSKTTILF